MTIDIAITYRGEGCNDPVDTCSKYAVKIQFLNATLIVHVYPTFLMLQQIVSDQAPKAGK